MKVFALSFLLFAVICFVNGQILSNGVDRLKEGVSAAGEAFKAVGDNVVDGIVGRTRTHWRPKRSIINSAFIRRCLETRFLMAKLLNGH